MGPENGQNQTNSSSTIQLSSTNHILNVCYANVDNSLLSKIDELKALMSEFNLDIVGLNEVKPKNGEIPTEATLQLPGYQLFCSDFHKEDTRGACIYVKNNLNVSQIFPDTGPVFNDAVWISITGGSSDDSILMGCVYRSGTPATAKKYDKELNKQLLWASNQSQYPSKIIFGDFNMPNISWNPEPSLDTSSRSRTANSDEVFIECIRDTFFYQLINEDTRHRNGNFSTLDLVFTNEASTLEQLELLDPIGASDHDVDATIAATTTVTTTKS